MKHYLKETGQLIRKNLGQLVLFELLYKGLFLLLMLPLAEFSFRFAIRYSDYSYVTPENLLAFLLKPATIGILLFLVVIFFLFSFVEIVALIIFFQTALRNKEIKVVQILFPGLKKAVRLLRRQNIAGLFFSTLFFTIISNVPLWICFYLRFSTIRFLVNEAWKNAVLRMVLALVFAFFIMVGFLGIFVMHCCCLKGTTFLESMRLSIRTLVKHPMLAAGNIVVWNLIFLLMEAVIYFFVLLLIIVVSYFTVSQDRLLAFLLRMEAEWNLYGGILASAVGMVANVGLLSHVVRKLLDNEEQEDEEWAVPEKESKVLRWMTVFVIAGNLTMLVMVVRNGSWIENEVLTEIAVTAHRGASHEAPENTLAALGLAIENMADYAEIDVQETKDGTVVLLHDYSLKRTTGEKKYIWNVTYDELCGLDCGSWLSEEFAGERIPTLEEALELCRGRINLNIEIKASAHSQALEEKVVALIEEYGFENQCVITSTSQKVLMKVKSLNENLKTGSIMSIVYGNFYEREGVDFFSMKSTFVNETVVQTAHRLGKEVHVWTVNSRSELERVKSIGVDNIITDYPLLAREIISGDGLSGTVFELFRMVVQN